MKKVAWEYTGILKIKRNPMRWQDVSSQCRLFVEENYSWEKNVDFLEKLIARIAA